MNHTHFPQKQGLYDPRFEHDACGVGFVCDIKSRASHSLIKQGLEVLLRLSHRGATGADPKTGDGAGLLIQIPHEFFLQAALETKIILPDKGEYASGLIFFPQDTAQRDFCRGVFEKTLFNQGLPLLGWRLVPVDNSDIGETARLSQPVVEQVFIGKGKILNTQGGLDFERRLYVARKIIENTIRASSVKQKSFFYITNLSSRTFSYKGLLMPEQLDKFFPDLKNPALKSAICLVHSRYSTNTFPAWDLAQPFRYLAHNGEINTLRGNINWMRAREGLLKSKVFGRDLERIFPVIVPGGSDSASIDNVFELLFLAGRPIQHVMMMLIPSAWEHDKSMPEKVRDFYKFHYSIMEPWDGPAAIAFTDGSSVGAVLDRNGLRPARYIVTKDDFAVMSSEAGVLDIPAKDIRISGRLEPGKIFYIDTLRQRIISDAEIKEEVSGYQPYSQWVKKYTLELNDFPKPGKRGQKPLDLITAMKAFGYTREDLKVILKPMAESGQEPTGSMGNDAPPAVLSLKPQLLYNYFKQMFAQVTNPAIDPIREELVMSLVNYIGPEKNILEESPGHCHKLMIESPVLADEELEKLKNIKNNGFKTKTIPIIFKPEPGNNFVKSLGRLCDEAALAIKNGYTFIMLSDRGVNKDYAALPALLAVGAVHHYLVKKALRKQIAIIVESAEPREVHHFALLFGYGADCVNPYLAYEALGCLIKEGELNLGVERALKNYIKAVNKGILKILSKMGISTLQSYRGAQIFEALGLNQEVIERCFSGTVSRISGAGFDVIYKETLLRHKDAYSAGQRATYLPAGGVYQWNKDGEFHLWNPDSIAALQEASRLNDYNAYKCFAGMINDQSKNPATLRGLFKFKERTPVPLEEVEPVEEILKRFASGAMSFGSISRPAHETLALAMNRMKAKSNTGEGGEDPARFIVLPNGDSLRSAIKQVASGRFGVTANYLVNADELQIKVAQGAKPGEGGQLPGHKVSAVIARTRYTTEGVTLISPPPHHDIYSIEDLAQLIFDLKNVNPRARISVKLVSEAGVGTVAAGVAKGHADMILISGGDGGTGASPLSSIKHAGLPWELGISETHQTLVLNDLRGRVRLQADGQMRTGRDVAVAALLGAEEFGFCTAALIVMGCLMLRHCHLNNCSLGVATQDEILQKRFKGRAEYVENYFRFVARELREIMAALGARKVDEIVGRVELLEINSAILPWKAREIDYSGILYRASRKTSRLAGKGDERGNNPPGALPLKGQFQGGADETVTAENAATRCVVSQNHGIADVLDRRLIELSKPALDKAEAVKIELLINNTNRSAGAMLSGEVCRRYGEDGLREDTIYYKFNGIAGQSFGAFLAKGVTFELEGMANDYVGKGISGGKIIIYPDKQADYKAENNIIIGNTAFYGAISGEVYIRGKAGERFCIRNSGLYAVVEGVGDHGCEYMTGGRVVVLGKTGRNFAAGMSGGIAYVYDADNSFRNKCNMDMVVLEHLEKDDENMIHELLRKHYKYTFSLKAKQALDNLAAEARKFVKVMPLEYKRVLGDRKQADKRGLSDIGDG